MSNAMQEWLGEFVGRKEFLSKYRYYASVLSRLIPVEDLSIPVMAVSMQRSRIYLHVNVEYYLKPGNFQYLTGVLLHEVHHIVLGHLADRRLRDVQQPSLMELAMEISANEYIREPLPGQPPVWNQFQSFGIAAGQSTMERYHLLCQAQATGKLIIVPTMVDSHLARGVAISPGGLPEIGSMARLRHLIAGAVQQADLEHGDAGGGGRLAGRDPGHFLEMLPESEEEPRTFLDWRTGLDMFIHMQRQPRTTYQRPNRRFPGRIGELPGRIHHPGRTAPKHMLVAIDTSGSMSTAELIEIAAHLRRLREHVTFTVVECDTIIHRVYPFEDAIRNVAGRGGTDLRPVFDADFLAEHRPDGVIYFTDGEGPYLLDDPGVKTLWVLTKPWQFGCAWGQKVHMKRAEPVAV